MTLAARQPKLPYPRPAKTDQRPMLVEIGRRSAWLHGEGVKEALDATRTPRMRCADRRVYTVPVDRVDDLLAYWQFGRCRRHVELVAVDR